MGSQRVGQDSMTFTSTFFQISDAQSTQSWTCRIEAFMFGCGLLTNFEELFKKEISCICVREINMLNSKSWKRAGIFSHQTVPEKVSIDLQK